MGSRGSTGIVVHRVAGRNALSVYVFGLRDGTSPAPSGVKQVVSIQGQGAATTFNQESGTKNLVVNGTEGNSANNLLTYAQTIIASAGGEITITVTADGALYAVAGYVAYKKPAVRSFFGASDAYAASTGSGAGRFKCTFNL